MAIPLTSPAFTENTPIPSRHTCSGENLSPALAWPKSLMAVKSYALIAEDPDAPSGVFVHWVLFNIPAERTQLPEGIAVQPEVPGVGRQGINDTRTSGYYGPCPPPGKPHKYFFNVYALDRMLDLPEVCTAAQLRQTMQSHLLDSGSLMGTCHR